jgi:2,3-diketo-5-methylthio-1-phosphopentane phosphatase
MKNKEKKLRVFVDFDGTLTEQEICLELCRHFCDNYPTVEKQLREGEIILPQAWKQLCTAIPATVTKEDLEGFIDRFELLPYVASFYQYCKELDIPVKIVSDGFDIYIRRLLANAGLGEIESFSNKLIRNSEGWDILFPGASESCICPSASCKRNVLLNNAEDDAIVVYIGDGVSDYCAVRHADIVFAKKRLGVYCSHNKIPHYPFKSFFDVKQRLQAIINDGKLKQRNQAVVKRKKAFEME